jgi:hypothetical protein
MANRPVKSASSRRESNRRKSTSTKSTSTKSTSTKSTGTKSTGTKSTSTKSTGGKSAAAKAVMLPTDRIAYSPIPDRPPLQLPNGARMAVWVVVNVEEWDATQPMPRTVLTPPAGGSPMPDVPNWAWHEYGNRVGFWRFVEIFDEFAIPGVIAINGSARAAYPAIVRAALERNWEFMGHGFTQRNLQKVPDERADIRKVRTVIAKATGKAPRGWLGPGLTETWQTPDILAEEGYTTRRPSIASVHSTNSSRFMPIPPARRGSWPCRCTPTSWGRRIG